ncbi:Oidioi.mRNA.OKI2018_I69.XSR.g16713.t1.cds [Oikopleura dioica]|uniref:Oidioi.mRNA.OKI2018_I69.XSR.g16713.t1.cds n=1 Tax=Oikopleura dioica TaxID=34765 RepID=A0ABN7SHH5_OIKDI|nr:Oidioi.mRNA.OKI2018_I69.XSR.g16713.t1.cds [Oikopleura dioica]
MSKTALDGFISSVNAVRQRGEENNEESTILKMSRLQRQLNCIGASCYLSVRTVRSERGAASILKKIVARLLGNDPTALCLIAVGLFHDLLSTVSELVNYHNSIKDQATKAIRDFLLTPAPVLIKLQKASKKGEYQQLREHGIKTFQEICAAGENNESAQVGLLCSKILSISSSNPNGPLAMDHLFALLTTFVTEKSDSQLKVFTTVHNTLIKGGLNLEKECLVHLTTLSIKIAEKSPPEDRKGENMAAEIIEIIIQSFVNTKSTVERTLSYNCLKKLAEAAAGQHKLWLLSRYLKLFFSISSEDKNDERVSSIMSCIALIVSSGAPDWNDPQFFSLRNSMRDFWFYCAVFGFSDMSIGWPDEQRADIMAIAKRSPTLSFLTNEPVKQTLENNPALKKGSSGSTIKEVQDLKLALNHSIGSRDIQLDGEIKALDYFNVLYHIAVLHIERLRLASYLVTEPTAYEYRELFTYIENQMVQRSKQAKDKILKEILITIFREYLSSIREFARTINIDICLVEKVQLLLVKFNSTNSTSRYVADSNLLATFNYFEHLVWQPAVIETELDIVQQLSFSLEDAEESFAEAHELSIPSIKMSLKLPDSLDKRKSMVLAMHRYLLEKPGILIRALKAAPKATKSHLDE